jgi:single-stranded DNA-binding protein
MSAHVLISGTLFRQPERKVSRGGKPYVSAAIRVRDGDASQFWRVMVFSESAGDEIMRLCDGDALSVSGSMRAEIWAPEGKDPRVSLTLTADAILPLRRERQPREKPAADTPAKSAVRANGSSSSRRIAGHRSPYAPHGAHPTDTDLNDDIPF